MTKDQYPSTLYFVLVRDDDGHIGEWTQRKTLAEAEMKKLEMEETRGYEKFTIEIRPVSALDAPDFIKKIQGQTKKNE